MRAMGKTAGSSGVHGKVPSGQSRRYGCGNRAAFCTKATQLPNLQQDCVSWACKSLLLLCSPLGFSPIGGPTAEFSVMKAQADSS